MQIYDTEPEPTTHEAACNSTFVAGSTETAGHNAVGVTFRLSAYYRLFSNPYDQQKSNQALNAYLFVASYPGNFEERHLERLPSLLLQCQLLQKFQRE